MSKIVIRHADCITGAYSAEGSEILRNATIIIEDGYITKIISGDEAKTPAGQQALEAAVAGAERIVDGTNTVAARSEGVV